MPPRPLIQKGVAELEKLFDQKRDDPHFLKILIAELAERTVPRAQELKRRAIQATGTTPKTRPQQRNRTQNQDSTDIPAAQAAKVATPAEHVTTEQNSAGKASDPGSIAPRAGTATHHEQCGRYIVILDRNGGTFTSILPQT